MSISLGDAGKEVFDALRKGEIGEHFIQYISGHLFSSELERLSEREVHGGYNHDLRRAMVAAITNSLRAQLAGLNRVEPKHSNAWSSEFMQRFYEASIRTRQTQTDLCELFQIWIERLEKAVTDESGRKLDELFPSGHDTKLPIENGELDLVLAEAASYASGSAGNIAPVWNDIFDFVLSPADDAVSSAQSLPPRNSWFAFRPKKRPEPSYTEDVDAKLEALGAAGLQRKIDSPGGLELPPTRISRRVC